MRSSPRALATVLVALGLPAWSQVGDGPVAPLTAPPAIYSSAPPSVAVGVPRAAPRPTFAAAAAAGATRLTAGAREERMFLRNAAAQSRFELDASRLAFARSSNPAVRSLAAALINHHNTIGLELTHLLNTRGMALPMIGNDQRKLLTRLNKASGKNFDALYMREVGLGQAAVAADYEEAAAAIRDPQLNAWIVRTLASTRFHQNLAERSRLGEAPQAAWNRAARPQVRESIAGVQPVAARARAISGSGSR